MESYLRRDEHLLQLYDQQRPEDHRSEVCAILDCFVPLDSLLQIPHFPLTPKRLQPLFVRTEELSCRSVFHRAEHCLPPSALARGLSVADNRSAAVSGLQVATCSPRSNAHRAAFDRPNKS